MDCPTTCSDLKVGISELVESLGADQDALFPDFSHAVGPFWFTTGEVELIACKDDAAWRRLNNHPVGF